MLHYRLTLILIPFVVLGCAGQRARSSARQPGSDAAATPASQPVSAPAKEPGTVQAAAKPTEHEVAELPIAAPADCRPGGDPSTALALVLDRSGSMTGQPLAKAKQAAVDAVSALGSSDRAVVIPFDSAAQRWTTLAPAADRQPVIHKINALQAGGGTDALPALELAYAELSNVPSRVRHVIFLTDGQFPSTGVLAQVAKMRSCKISLTTFGLGTSVDTEFLEAIARDSGGRVHLTSNPDDLPELFVRDLASVREP